MDKLLLHPLAGDLLELARLGVGVLEGRARRRLEHGVDDALVLAGDEAARQEAVLADDAEDEERDDTFSQSRCPGCGFSRPDGGSARQPLAGRGSLQSVRSTQPERPGSQSLRREEPVRHKKSLYGQGPVRRPGADPSRQLPAIHG